MIDPTAIIDPSAQLSSGVHIGPYSIIGPHVEIGKDTEIGSHVVIKGPTKIGSANKVYPFASIGEDPQDKKYGGEPTLLEIGDRNVIRESCTINRGTVQDVGVTRIGDDNWIMAYVHIAHDCQIGNSTVIANNVALAGHVKLADNVTLGGFSLVFQFIRIGIHAFTSMGSVIQKDVPPFVKVAGHMAKPYGLNTEGLKRRGFSPETVSFLKKAYRIIYRSNLTLKNAIEQLSPLILQCPEVDTLKSFLQQSERGIIR